MYSEYYMDGTVSVEAGSNEVTGAGTAWSFFGVPNGMFMVPGFPPIPILSDPAPTDTSLRLAWNWPHGDQENVEYAIALVTADQVTGLQTNWLQSQILARNVGFAFDANAVGSLAARDTYDGEAEGFTYGVLDDPENPVFYRKMSDASGDWDGPFKWRGPAGSDGQNASLAELLEAADPLTVTDAATIAIDLNLGDNLFHQVTLGDNRTLGFPTDIPNAGVSFYVKVKQDGTGGRTLGFASGYEGSRGVLPTISDQPNAETLLVVVILSVTRAAVMTVGQDFA